MISRNHFTKKLLFPKKKVHVRDPPTIKLRPEDEYMKSVGEKVTFPCSASGSPAPTITWRRPDGFDLPKKRHKEYQGTLTISGLQKKDHGIYECVVSGPGLFPEPYITLGLMRR